MTIAYNKIAVRVRLGALRRNFEILRRMAPAAMPVIKSDAYGHGLLPVARTLEAAGTDAFAAGTVGECAQLRDGGIPGRIVALLGATDAADAECCVARSIVPAVYSADQLELLAGRAAPGQQVDIALKFDTGMARLGFTEADLPALLDRLHARPMLRPVLVMSHLAVSDDPSRSDFTRQQGEAFGRILAGVRAEWPAVHGSLANSAALLAHPELHFDVQRPGIALYGANPLRGTAQEHLGDGLQPAMDVAAPILQVHPLPAGRSISYGRTFTAPRDMTVAIVATGYADAYSRGLSGKGAMTVHGRRVPILGRVCMQMTAVDVTDVPGVAAGEDAYLLGGPGEALTPDELADLWGTISYEVLCLLGMNPRTHRE